MGFVFVDYESNFISLSDEYLLRFWGIKVEMPGKRPTEASWDSDEDLLGDDSNVLNSLTFGKDLDDVDEDALLGGSDDEASMTSNAFATRVNEEMTSFQDDVLQIDFNEPDDLDDVPTNDDQSSQFSGGRDNTSPLEFEEALESVASDHSSLPEAMSSFNEASWDRPMNKSEEVTTEAQDNYDQSDEEDSESDDEGSRQRGRFRTERTMSSSAHLSKLQTTTEKRDIPDNLEISNEDQERIEQFMQNSTKPWKRHPPRQGQLSARQSVPLLANNIRHSSAPAPHHSQPSRGGFIQRFHTQQRHGAPPTNEMMRAAMNNNTARFRAGVAKRPGTAVNPHFASNNPPMEVCTGQLQHHYPSLMSLGMGQRQPNQQHQFSGQLPVPPSFVRRERPMLNDQGHRMSAHQSGFNIEPQQIMVQQSGTSFFQHHIPGSMANIVQQSNQQQPPPLIPQATHTRFLQHAGPQNQILHQPGFVNQHVVNQSQMVNSNQPRQEFTMSGQQVGFSGGPINQQPLHEYHLAGQFGQQQQQRLPAPQQRHYVPVCQQPTFIVNQPSSSLPVSNHIPTHHVFQHPHSGSYVQNTSSLRIVQPSVSANAVVAQPRFELATKGEPEMVGQPIETVVHNREDPPRTGSVSAAHPAVHKQLKVEPVVRNRPLIVTAATKVDNSLRIAKSSPSVISTEDIELKKKLDARARRFAAPPPDVVSQTSDESNVRLRLGVKRLSDQGAVIDSMPTPAKQPMPAEQSPKQSALPTPVKQSLLITGRKSLARAIYYVQQKAQRELQLQQTSQTPITKQLSNVQSNQQQQEGLQRQVVISKTDTLQQAQPVDVLRKTIDVKTPVSQILSQIKLQTRRKPAEEQSQETQPCGAEMQKSNLVTEVESSNLAKQEKPDMLKQGNSARSVERVENEIEYDAEYEAALEVQKRLREQILLRKESRRQMQAIQRQQELETSRVEAVDSTSSVAVTRTVATNLPRTSAPHSVLNNVSSTTRGTFKRLGTRNVNLSTGVRQPILNIPRVRNNFVVRSPVPSGFRVRPLLSMPGQHGTVMSFPRGSTTPDILRSPGSAESHHGNSPQFRAHNLRQNSMRHNRFNNNTIFNQLRSPQSQFGSSSNNKIPLSTSRVVSIGGLSSTTSFESVRQLVEALGPVQEIQMIQHERRAMVKFFNSQHAQEFAAKYNRRMIDLSMLSVSII